MWSPLVRVIAALLALTSLDGLARAKDQTPALGREIGFKSFDKGIRKIAWSPDSRHVLVLEDSATLTLYDIGRGTIRWTQKMAAYRDAEIAFLPGGQILTSYTLGTGVPLPPRETRLRVRNAEDGSLVDQFISDGDLISHRTNGANGFALSEDGRKLAARFGPDVLIYDTSTWATTKRIGPLMNNPGLRFAPGARITLDLRRDRLVVSGRKGTWLPDQIKYVPMQTWSVSGNSVLADFTTYKTGLGAMILDPASGNIVTGGDGVVVPFETPPIVVKEKIHGVEDEPESKVRAYDPISGALTRIYRGSGGGVTSLHLSADGRHLVAAKSRRPDDRSDAYVLAWEAATGRLIAATNYSQKLVAEVSISPDGKRLAVAAGSTLQIIDLDPKLFASTPPR